MKTRTYLLLAALLMILTGGTAARAKEAKEGGGATAKSILEKSVAAYSSVKSYVGTTSVRAKGKEGKEMTASALITFQRPGKIRIEGKDMSGHNYVIVGNGTTTWLSWKGDKKGVRKEDSLEMAVATMTGVAVEAPTVVPASLMNLKWGSVLSVAAKSPSKLRGHEKIRGADCYKISSDTAAGKYLFWVDSKTSLLRQLSHGTPAGVPKADFVHSFIVKKLNASVSKKLFQPPK